MFKKKKKFYTPIVNNRNDIRFAMEKKEEKINCKLVYGEHQQ